MSYRVTTIIVPCDEGNVEAIRLAHNNWDINFPWGAERYWGSPSEIRARIKQIMKTQDLKNGKKHD